MDNRTYYEILGLPKNGIDEEGKKISIESITNAKNALKFGEEDGRAPFTMWDKIDEAYSVLSDQTRRNEYDKLLGESVIVNNNEITDKSEQTSNFSNVKNINSLLQMSGKSSLKKNKQEQSIVEFKTQESNLIENYRKELEHKINQLLSENHYNYSLKIEKIKYENYIELLKKIIELRQNVLIRKDEYLQAKFQIISLKKQLEKFQSNLEEINKKIKEVESKTNVSRIQEELLEINKKMKF